MKLLGIVTAGNDCSVAVLSGQTICTRVSDEARAHASTVLPMVDAVLDESGVELTTLDGIAFGRGPGAFTGVRIAASVAQGIALAVGLRVAPVSDLAALAQGAIDAGQARVLAAVDARMGEIYSGFFERGEDGFAVALDHEQVARPEQMSWLDGSWFGSGNAFAVYPAFRQRAPLAGCDPAAHATAACLVRLAARPAQRFVEPEEASPVYLRDNVADLPMQAGIKNLDK